MTVVDKDVFLDRLYEVVHKLVGIAKTQTYRYKNMWANYFSSFDFKPHLIRDVNVNKEKFYNDLDYRIQTMKAVGDSMVDAFYSIKSILQIFYQHYFLDSELFLKDFPNPEDQTLLKYVVAKEILGSLIQYSKMDHETVPLKYHIIARHHIMMKLKGVKLQDIINDLHKLNKNIEVNIVKKIMKEIEDDGIITIHNKGDEEIYKLKKELKLNEHAKKAFVPTLRPLVDWPTNFWRSFYNIRELNLTPSDSTPHRDFLIKILEKSATQGFGPAYFVFQNLEKYYQQVKADSK